MKKLSLLLLFGLSILEASEKTLEEKENAALSLIAFSRYAKGKEPCNPNKESYNPKKESDTYYKKYFDKKDTKVQFLNEREDELNPHTLCKVYVRDRSFLLFAQCDIKSKTKNALFIGNSMSVELKDNTVSKKDFDEVFGVADPRVEFVKEHADIVIIE